MATAPAQEQPQSEANDDAPIDYTAEATRLGWKPADDFKGDPSKHIDAETFYKRGQEVMPILQAQNKALLKRLDAMEKQSAKAAEFFSKSEERGYARALAEIRAEQEAAVESGDLAAHKAASAKLDKLEKPETAKPVERDPAQRAEDFADWVKTNKWYNSNPALASYADSQADILARKSGGFLGPDDLAAISEKVKAKFEDEFPDAFGTPKPRPRNPVDGVPQNRTRASGYTFADLPAEAKAIADKWVKNGTIKSRDDYVKSFDFKGYNA